MADITLDPPFNPSVKTTLQTRRGWVENRNHAWNYKKHAYFILYSMGADSGADDNECAGILMQQNLFSNIHL